MINKKWDRRVGRANELASTYPFSAEGLSYYVRVATFRKAYTRKFRKLSPTHRRFRPTDRCEMNWIFFFSCQNFPDLYQ
jgi:hypothetical protein